MKIYSQNIVLFIAKCETWLKQIITQETPHNLLRSRFKMGHYTYPLHIVVFTDSQNLGYFDPHTYQIGLHQNLMFSAKEHVIKNILRHELAHYLCYIENQDLAERHGDKFKEICTRYAWEDRVSKASLNIDLANNYEGDLVSEKLINKVKALLKLAESDNVHEAELATIKANQLLLKHNISNLDMYDAKLYIKSILEFKRRNAKLNAIYEIIKHFLVKPVFVYGRGCVFLEVSGSKENVELAEYLGVFLDRELENLWKRATHLTGLRAKNSFFTGIARGHDEKMHTYTKDYSPSDQKALIKITTDLDEKVKKFYRSRLSSGGQSGSSLDSEAYQSGKQTGKSLTINAAVKNKAKTFLLNWSNR